MAGKFEWKKFKDVDINDTFFDTLKGDYIEFPDWFQRKRDEDASALVFDDEQGVGAFVYLKKETEPIELIDKTLPSLPRVKIGTLRLAERFRGLRLGEGALGVSLWKWRDTKYDEIYVTVFEKHKELISLFDRFGFTCVGKNTRGEYVYIKNRHNIDYSTPYKSFPFIRPDFNRAGVMPIFEEFHDKLFPYSELRGNKREIEEETAGNGITKIYIGTPYTATHYKENDPVCIYRIHTGNEQKTYKSAITSYCMISKVYIIKSNGRVIMSLEDFIKNAGNKTIFSVAELANIYNRNNVVMFELVYNGFFGKGHNVIHKKLSDQGLFQAHPYNIEHSKEQFIKILEMGDVDVQNVIID